LNTGVAAFAHSAILANDIEPAVEAAMPHADGFFACQAMLVCAAVANVAFVGAAAEEIHEAMIQHG